MGLINREKRQHAWPARTMAPPTFACAGERAPRCSLVRCPSHLPKVAALGPEASDSAPPRPEQRACILGRQQGWRFNSGAPPAHVFSHLTPPASSALPALSLVDQLRPPNCRFTSAKVPNLRAPRRDVRQTMERRAYLGAFAAVIRSRYCEVLVDHRSVFSIRWSHGGCVGC